MTPRRRRHRPHQRPRAPAHTFAAIELSEAGGDILSLSRALGHSKPSTTLNEYGHLAPAGLEPLMARIDGLVAGKGTSA